MARTSLRLIFLLAVPLLASCRSAGAPGGAKCLPRPGMTTAELVACDCRVTSSGGAAMTGNSSGALRKAVTFADYVCPLGETGLARVSVAYGIVREVTK